MNCLFQVLLLFFINCTGNYVINGTCPSVHFIVHLLFLLTLLRLNLKKNLQLQFITLITIYFKTPHIENQFSAKKIFSNLHSAKKIKLNVIKLRLSTEEFI